MSPRRAWPLLSALCLLAQGLLGCGDDTADDGPPVETGVTFMLELGADLSDPAQFYDVPYPSDLRLDAGGHPDLRGFPNPSAVITVADLVRAAQEVKGFPVLPVTFLRFTGPLSPRLPADVIPADPASPILLVDVDPASPERGRLFPIVAETLGGDPYTSENVLAVAARPGFVLRASTQYAVVVRANAQDAQDKPLAHSPLLDRIAAGATPGEGEQAAFDLYAPLYPALDVAGVDAASVVAATVFTTGAVVEDMAALGDALKAKYDVTIDGLALDTTEIYPELCLLRGTVTLPQFQEGTPPFDTQGFFAFDASGLPVEQNTVDAPVAVVIPRLPMPAAGYPLVLNVHGSGGFSIAMVRPVGDAGVPDLPIGPAFPYATKGIGMAGIAMPLNPERLPGAEETAYLNVNNLPAIRDTFRQGIVDARLFLEAIATLQIPEAELAACTGATLPVGQTSFKFDPAHVMITGQSMGGMYTNLIGATEPMILAAVPTGAGGHWTHFLLETPLREGNIPTFLTLLLGTQVKITFLHPVLAIGAGAVEPADPMIYMPRIARQPLPGHPVRPVYEPTSIGDSYFPTTTYDAVALAYGHQQTGGIVWPEMQEALALDGKDGLLGYSVTNNLMSESGDPYTGVVVQYEADGPYDPHAIYSHRDDVKRQYSCFFDTFVRTGVATVVPPTTDWAAACP